MVSLSAASPVDVGQEQRILAEALVEVVEVVGEGQRGQAHVQLQNEQVSQRFRRGRGAVLGRYGRRVGRVVAYKYDPPQRIETSRILVIKDATSPTKHPIQNPQSHHQPASIPSPSVRPTPRQRYPCNPNMPS